MAASLKVLTRTASYFQIFCLQKSATSVGNNLRASTRILNHKPFSSGNVMLNNDPLSDKEVKSRMEVLTDKFAEARELMDDARESQGTVYFSQDLEEAQEAVKDTLEEYNTLLSKLSEKQRQNVVASLGLRMEELKAQQAAIEESLKD